jgi:hypothetical protein
MNKASAENRTKRIYIGSAICNKIFTYHLPERSAEVKEIFITDTQACIDVQQLSDNGFS